MEYIKAIYNLAIKKHWLFVINKEIKRYNKYDSKMKVSSVIIHDLMDRFNEIYDNKEN